MFPQFLWEGKSCTQAYVDRASVRSSAYFPHSACGGVFPAAVVATGKRSRRYKAQFWFPARGPRKRKTILIPVKLGKPLAV